jgi:hypothetical protein
MPNTLVHLGIQGFASRAIRPAVDLRLVYLACVIPDIPWIIQRAILFFWPNVDRIDLMLAGGVQSSLLFCLLFCVAIASIALKPWNTFLILSTGSLFHLILDALQIKFGRGVILLAPFDWRPYSLGLIWPEHPLFYLLAGASLIFVVVTWRTIDHAPLFRRLDLSRYPLAVFLLGTYLLAPIPLSTQLFEKDVYFSRTISDKPGRARHYAEFDRARLLRDEEGRPAIEIFSGEVIPLEGAPVPREGLASVSGTFNERGAFAVKEIHFHPPGVRIVASLIGLSLILLIWTGSVRAWLRAGDP